jgi:carboxypeptidase C (cathepsin A)
MDPTFTWDMKHQPPSGQVDASGLNVMPDLAFTMKANPKMKLLLAGGYYDLATPFYEGIYEMHHLQIPQKLQSNIEYKYYESGHMVYVNEQVLAKFHDDVAAFVKSTESGK